MSSESVQITVTPTDRGWLRFATEVMAGRREASDVERRRAAMNIDRLLYRAVLAEDRAE